VRALLLPLFPRSAWALSATVEADKTCEGAHLAFVSSVFLSSVSHCGGGHDRSWSCSGLCSLGRGGIVQRLEAGAKREVRALLWPLLAWSSWSQPATLVAGTTGQRAALASLRFVGVGSSSHCGSRHDR
jgi:hypothetical protein